jgi:uncharacterized membrane protein
MNNNNEIYISGLVSGIFASVISFILMSWIENSVKNIYGYLGLLSFIFCLFFMGLYFHKIILKVIIKFNSEETLFIIAFVFFVLGFILW